MIRGATPALEYPRIRARGTRCSAFAREAHDYMPPPPNRKKQEREARRETAERRARDEGRLGGAAVRAETNASPELSVKLGDATKH